MGRPGLLEFALYAVVIGGTAAWVYALPPFDHEPGSSRPAEVGPVVASAPSSSAEPSAAETDNGSEPDPAAREPASATETPAIEADASEPGEQPRSAASEPGEQPRLDPQPNLLMVTATRLNMRSEPNSRSELVGSYPRGALVEPVTTSGNWVLVRTIEDETFGWMYAGYLDDAVTDFRR